MDVDTRDEDMDIDTALEGGEADRTAALHTDAAVAGGQLGANKSTGAVSGGVDGSGTAASGTRSDHGGAAQGGVAAGEGATAAAGGGAPALATLLQMIGMDQTLVL